jgi:hypothetical protein
MAFGKGSRRKNKKVYAKRKSEGKIISFRNKAKTIYMKI